ncbi:MAG: M23 family metallopeptidase [Flavobacteriaceae bacterium]|nr:M23 family metallopeptidase [Flavobacteriaceae bacterium]
MKNCICYSQIIDYNSTKNLLIDPNNSLTINSNKPNVISISEGKVSKILKHEDNTYSILIRKGDLFYVYSHISSVAKKIQIDKSVSKGDKIGKGIVAENGDYTIQFEMFNKTDQIQNVKNYVDCKFVEK